MRSRILAKRILAQLKTDRRTIALVLVAPILILSLLYFIMNGSGATHTVVIGSAPESIIEEMKSDNDVNLEFVYLNVKSMESTPAQLKQAIKDMNAVAAINVSDDLDKADIYLDGTNPTDSNKVKKCFASAYQEVARDELNDKIESVNELIKAMPIGKPDINLDFNEINTDYIYGSEDDTMFDSFSSALIGFIVFFLVFLISGINFLTERTSGTLEKMLSTPIRRSEIVLGYTMGYSVLAIIQTVIITLFVVYVLGVQINGSILLVLLTNILTAVCALTMGTLISCLANSEFQMMQFIPIIVIPQLFLCGLFSLSAAWYKVGHFMPLYYSAHSLQEVIIRGHGIDAIWQNLLILAGFSLLFIVLNIVNLRKYRKW